MQHLFVEDREAFLQRHVALAVATTFPQEINAFSGNKDKHSQTPLLSIKTKATMKKKKMITSQERESEHINTVPYCTNYRPYCTVPYGTVPF